MTNIGNKGHLGYICLIIVPGVQGIPKDCRSGFAGMPGLDLRDRWDLWLKNSLL
jgi:hypothetical protein